MLFCHFLHALLQQTTFLCAYIIDFFRQIEDYTKEYANAPLLQMWIGPVPFLVLFHVETVEV